MGRKSLTDNIRTTCLQNKIWIKQTKIMFEIVLTLFHSDKISNTVNEI